VSFTGISGNELIPDLQRNEEYILMWDVIGEAPYLEGRMFLHRSKGEKEISVDVICLEEGQYLEIFCMTQDDCISEALSVGECCFDSSEFAIDDFVDRCYQDDHLFLVIHNRGTEIPLLSKEPDWFCILSSGGKDDRYPDMKGEKRIAPGICAIIDLGPLSELDGMAGIMMANGNTIDLFWQESSGEEPPEPSGNTDAPSGSGGGCALTVLSKESLVLFLSLFLAIFWKS
jgi:hypothetical protein